MAARSKRAQLEAQGWKFTAVPTFYREGYSSDPRTGQSSPARYDHKYPAAWIATPPGDSPVSERRFQGHSPTCAIRWAYRQAIAPRLQPGLSGVAALTALMGQAQASGVVGDATDDADRMVQRPDAELLSLCHEATKAGQISDKLIDVRMSVLRDREALARVNEVDREATRVQGHAVARVIALKATTQAGLIAKARLVTPLFSRTVGQKGEAVRSLLADLLAVFEVTP